MTKLSFLEWLKQIRKVRPQDVGHDKDQMVNLRKEYEYYLSGLEEIRLAKIKELVAEIKELKKTATDPNVHYMKQIQAEEKEFYAFERLIVLCDGEREACTALGQGKWFKRYRVKEIE